MASGPSGLSILVDEKRVNDLLAQKTGIKALVRAGCNLSVFIAFVSLFTLLALGEPFSQNRAFSGFVRRKFDTDAQMSLDEVDTITDFWRYTNVTLLPAIYGNDTRKYTYPGYVLEKFLPMGGANRLFGVVRLRQLKVLPGEGCSVSGTFSGAFPVCNGPYSVASENKEEFGPLSPMGEPEFRWYKAKGSDTFAGRVSDYPTSGYQEVLTSDFNTSFWRLRMMEEENWIDDTTRAIFYEFTIYNFNTGVYAVCTIAFEIAPSGRFVKTFTVDTLMQRHLAALGFGDTADWLVLVGEVILLLFVLRYLMEEASEFLGCEARGERRIRVPTVKTEYFTDAWNLLDWLNLLIMVATLGMRAATWSKASALQVYVGDPAKQTVRTFTDMSGVAANVRTIHALLATNAVLTWFKAVKYINIIPYITTFMQTVRVAQKLLGSFIVVFTATLLGFVLGYSIAFGEDFASFRTTWKAYVFLMRTFVGDSNMQVVVDADPFLGSLLILLFVVGMFFLIMNLFYAIMISALADAKQIEDQRSVKKMQQMKERLDSVWYTLNEQFKLEQNFRAYLPGLYSRIGIWKKKKEKKEQERDEAMALKLRAKSVDDMQALGPGAPTFGRRKRRPLVTSVAALEDDVLSDPGSEPDLGPLRHKEQLYHTDEWAAFTGGLVDGKPPEPEPTPECIDLVVDATRYVAAGICERTRGARGVLFSEMSESKEVLLSIATVLEVLGRRARDLEAQQRQVLKSF
jgi:hypothetical protein